MSKYIFQLRRGWKYDKDPETGLPRDDWAEYDNLPDAHRVDPLPGELVLEYDNGIPRLKIGTGNHKFGELPYMSVDSFILPKTASVYLDPTKWVQASDGDDDRFHQVVTVQNAAVTQNSKVDLTPDAEMLDEFHGLDLVFVTENNDGVVSVFCIGEVPTKPYTIPVTVTEVVCNG